jgi:hypothetical protein
MHDYIPHTLENIFNVLDNIPMMHDYIPHTFENVLNVQDNIPVPWGTFL